MFKPSQPVDKLVNMSTTEQSTITCLADTGAYASFSVTCVAFASTAQADYIAFTKPDGTKFALWMDKDAAGTTPTGAIYTAADTKTSVAITTGMTAAQVAGALAGTSVSGYTLANPSGGLVTFTCDDVGDTSTPASHNADDTGAGSLAVSAISDGADSNLQSTYVLLGDQDTNYYAWLNLSSEGVDPAVAGRTAAAATESYGASASAIATALASAIDGKADLVASASSNVVTVTTTGTGPVPNIGAGNSGFTVAATIQGGSPSEPNGASSVDSLVNEPSLIS
jgi:hypothetical protein